MLQAKVNKIVILILSIVVVIESLALIIFWINFHRKIARVPLPIFKGKIAIVIDDWGYNLNNSDILDQIKYPLTMAVLPSLNYSQVVASDLHKRGFEIILHLPMEPRERYRLEKNTIMSSFDEITIKKILEQDLANIAYAKGVSNHMGSRATENPRVMEIIFKELKRRHIYFLDSFVSGKSVCSNLANKMHFPFARRDVFLDIKDEPEYIRGQIYKLKAKAAVFGQAIGIGHSRKTSLEVLKETMPQIEKEGYKFVFVSELVK